MGRKGGHWCSAPRCRNDGNTSNRRFFRFPKETGRWLAWVTACDRQDLIEKGPYYAYRNCTLCSDHFEDKMYLNDLKNRLMHTAVPTIFPGCKSPSDEPVEENMMYREVPDTAFVVEEVTDETAAALSLEMETSASDSSTTSRKRKLQSQLTEELKKVAGSSSRSEHVSPAILEIDVKAFQELTSLFLPEQLAKLVSLQAALHNKEGEGYSRDNEWKQFGLYLYFLSPKVYKFISNTFRLPSIKTLQRYTQSWDVNPGLSDNIFAGLKLKSKSMTTTQKQCILCIDQMPLSSHLFYNLSKDQITGLPSIDRNNNKQLSAAGSVLVIMARGLTSEWKQPLGYYFLKSVCTAESIRKILWEAIDRLKEIYFKVRCVVADESMSFRVFVKHNHITADGPYFIHDRKKIYFMYDPCRLLEAVRSNLMNYDYRWSAFTASWEPINKFYARDSQQRVRAAPKLTPIHLQPIDFKENGVRCAAQVFSSTVAAALSTYVSLGAMPLSAVGTVRFIERMDKLFDVFNSSKVRGSKIHNLPFTGSVMQVQFLNEMLLLFKDIKAIDKNGKNVTNTITCFKGWQMSIKCLLLLWDTLEEEGLPFLLTRRLSQDCLEKFFLAIKQESAKGRNPTPIQFTRTFKKLSALRLMRYSKSGNCTTDFNLIVDMMSQTDPLSLHEEIIISRRGTVEEIRIEVDMDYVYMGLPETNTLKYICGYLMSQCLKEHSCFACKRYATDNPLQENVTVFCSVKPNNKNGAKNSSKYLTVPSRSFCIFVYLLEKKFFEAFQKHLTEKCVGQKIIEELKTVPFRPPCPSFPHIYLLKLFMRMRVYYTIKYYNCDLRTTAPSDGKLINISYL